MVKDPAITKSNQLANQNAYITTDCLIAGTINQLLITGAGNHRFTVYTVDTTHDQLLRIDPMVYISSMGATTLVTFTLEYTDQGGVAVVTQLATFTGINQTVSIPSQTIYAQKNTNVQLNVNLNIAGAQVNLYASCQFVGVQN